MTTRPSRLAWPAGSGTIELICIPSIQPLSSTMRGCSIARRARMSTRDWMSIGLAAR